MGGSMTVVNVLRRRKLTGRNKPESPHPRRSKTWNQAQPFFVGQPPPSTHRCSAPSSNASATQSSSLRLCSHLFFHEISCTLFLSDQGESLEWQTRDVCWSAVGTFGNGWFFPAQGQRSPEPQLRICAL